MEQVYDRALKSLMEDHAAEMLPELLPGAELVTVENIELNRPNLRAVLVYLIKYSGEPRILNLELQTDNDTNMNYRMLLYYVELYSRYKIPIISMIMYPFEKNVPEPIFQGESGTGTSISFKYQILQLCFVEAEQCLRRGVISMYTLLPAMKGVTVAMLMQAISEIEQRYPQPHLTRHLLRFRTILRRSKTLSIQDKQIVEARMKSYDSLLDGDVELQREIQGVIQRRVEEGIQEGIQKELEKAAHNIIEERQQAVLDVVEVRFPALLEIAKQYVIHIEERNELRHLAKQIVLAPDEQTARWALNTYAA